MRICMVNKSNLEALVTNRVFLRFCKISVFIGLFCYLQYLVLGVLGVIIGYSIQMVWSKYILILAGPFVLFVIFIPRYRIIGYIVSLMIIHYGTLFLLTSLGQENHIKQGKRYYEQAQYQAAIEELKKGSETYTWHMRLNYSYPYSEGQALKMLARTYCQLGEFAKAADALRLIKRRYPRSLSE